MDLTFSYNPVTTTPTRIYFKPKEEDSSGTSAAFDGGTV